MGKFIKRGHTTTKLPQNSIHVVFFVSVCPKTKVSSYAFVLNDPQAGLIEDSWYRMDKPWRAWYDCLKDILSRVPKKSVVMIHVRRASFVKALISDEPLPNDRPETIRERNKIYKIIEREGLVCYAHFLALPPDVLESHTKGLARILRHKICKRINDKEPF